MMSYEEACDRGYDGPPPSRRVRYRCGGYASYHGHCGAYDCDTCYPGGGYDDDEPRTETVSKTRTVTARKPRCDKRGNEIRPGDRVLVISGFEYEVGGARLGYFRREVRVQKGPAWEA